MTRTTLALLLAAALGVAAVCDDGNGDSDADADGDVDGDVDTDGDVDGDGDSDGDVDGDGDGDSPAIEGCAIFPPDNPWNVDVSAEPVDSRSEAILASIGVDGHLRADFGTEWEGAPNGIPYVVVGPDQPLVTVTFDYADESDPGPYPIPSDAPIEGGPDSDDDRHVIVVQTGACRLWEIFYAWPQTDGSWEATSGAIFDLSSNALRPDTWTSADAAGLPVLPGLVRYDEVAAGEILHALRFTVDRSRRAFVHPATHWASSDEDEALPPMGMRVRLRGDFDLSGFSPEVQVILRALQRYGMLLADNGSDWSISGAPDERWDDDMLRELFDVAGSDLEVVQMDRIYTPADF